MCKALILLIEIASLIKFGLQTLVVDHRVHAVLIRQREVKQLELDRYGLLPAVGVYSYGSGIKTSGKVSIRVDFDPYGLILIAVDANRKAAETSTGVLGNQLYRLPSPRGLA